MENPTYNTLATLLTLLTMLIAVVSMFVSIYQSKITQDIAQRSNDLADKVVKSTLFEYKLKANPSLSALFIYAGLGNDPKPTIFLILKNEERGMAIVERIIHQGYTVLNETDIPLPFELRYNNYRPFIIQLNRNFGVDFNVNRFQYLQNSYFADCLLIVVFKDELGNRYQTQLNYNPQLQKHSGINEELSS